MRLHIQSLIIAIVIFIIEVLIATVFKNIFFVRAYLGDVLVIMLLYYIVKIFYDFNATKLIGVLLLFSFLIEFLQYFHFGEWLGFADNKLLMIILGNSFSWIDMLCYFAGAVILYLLEVKFNSNQSI